jgi:hypothetical protein
MTRYHFYAVLISLLTIPAQAQDTNSERGAQLLAPFKQSLQGALREGLAESPVHAIGICQVQAPRIAESLSADNVRVGRSSHRLRNPANTAPDWVSPVLQEYLDSNEQREPRTVDLAGNQIGYVEPIVMQPMCITCHGDNLAPDITTSIQALYPEDRATGFAVGDLRGVFWVEFLADKP